MCGIAAVIGRPEKISPREIAAMTSLVAHRGPDGEGFAALGNSDFEPEVFASSAEMADQQPRDIRVALGHRRLSIVDLSRRGHQPMASADRRVWVSYNGEIYNHVELRRELEALGHKFTSSSDTEVLIAAYQQWGEAAFPRFNGMFAFVLVDRSEQIVWAVRDRFGIKPLYWWMSPLGFLAFASEIKQFTCLSGWKARLNGSRARDFLIAGAYEHTNETLFRDVMQLRGGEAMRVSLDDPTIRRIVRWYELKPKSCVMDAHESESRFRELLTDSVRLRLRADVSVGSCLSGGLDSSSIVCLASEIRKANGDANSQLAFSALSDSPKYDERRFAQAVAERANVDLHTVTPKPDRSLDEIDGFVWSLDEPFGSTSIFAQSEVFALAAMCGIKVMLDGQGADEALGGYPVFRGTVLGELVRKWDPVGLLRELRLAPAGALKLIAGALAPSQFIEAMRSHTADQASSWFDHDRIGARPKQPFAAGDTFARSSFEALSRDQLLFSSLPALLHWEDRNSMSHSIEARVPFLDYRLVEFIISLPTNLKYRDGIGKRILREAMVGCVPQVVLNRTDKLGFQLAEDEWIKAQPGAMRGMLESSIVASDGIVRPGIITLFDQFLAGARPYSFLFWRVASFSRWMQRFNVAVS